MINFNNINTLLGNCILFQHDKVEILGSYALFHFLHDRHFMATPWTPNDVDVYCKFATRREFREFVVGCCDKLNERLPFDCKIDSFTQVDLVHDVKLSERLAVSFIYVEDGISMYDVCNGFDLSCCKIRAVLFGSRIFTKPLDDHVKRLTLNMCIEAKNLIMPGDDYEFLRNKLRARQEKYENRGFYLIDAQLMEMNVFKIRMMESYYYKYQETLNPFVVLFIGKLLLARDRARHRIYMPGGVGYQRAMVDWNNNIRF